MDSRTSRRLQQINMEEAMKHRRNLVRKSKPFREARERVLQAYNDPHLTDEQRVAIGKLLDSDMYDREEKVINDKAAKDIEDSVDGRIKHDLKTGRLKPAKRDAFIRRQQEWHKRK